MHDLIKNYMEINWNILIVSACGVWGVRVGIQVSKNKFHTHIYLDYDRVEFLFCIYIFIYITISEPHDTNTLISNV